MKSLVVIPALNPDKDLLQYIDALVSNGIEKIILVNDGSDSEYEALFDKIKKTPECSVVVHKENQGKGKSLKDALRYYQDNQLYCKFNGVITVDADGQHTVNDVIRVSKEMQDNQEALILGERAFDKNVPFRSKFGNGCTRTIFKALYGISIYDTQTGLRGIPNRLIEEFIDLKGNRYEYEMNMLITCAMRKIPIKSIVIETVYINDNSSSHFNAVKDSIRIYKLMLG